jgi:hypothetical protein
MAGKMRPSRRSVRLFLTACALVLGISLHADEGFWPFSSVPKAAIKARYGFDPGDEWLRHLQLSSVRFPGGSGSFVSADGLVMTNSHVALDAVSKLSTPQRDLVTNGFYARTRAEELKTQDLELNVLVSMDDVTARVNAAVQPAMTAAAALEARQAAMTRLEQESDAATGTSSTVVTLYQGGQYHLYRYRKYTDVRLVFSPEYDSAFFGGDPDNFMYPRWNFDMALLRVYDGDRPVRSEHFLQWSPEGSREGDLVFTSGHPGATQRLNTVAHLEYLRDTGTPFALRLYEALSRALQQYGRAGAEEARQAADELLSIDNNVKRSRGQLSGLQDTALMSRKRTLETQLRQKVAASPELTRAYGDAWEAVEQARRRLASYAREYQALEGSVGLAGRYVTLTRSLVRLAAERAKPNAERLPEFTDARRATLERTLFSTAPLDPAMETVRLGAWLAFMASELGPDHAATKRLLAGRTPTARAAELIKGTRVADVAARKQLADGGSAAIAAATDPLVVFVREIDPAARAIRKRFEDEVTGVERLAYAKIAQAVFTAGGAGVYPDGTGTLRLSYGAVKGYTENGAAVRPFTDLGGLYQRAAQFGSQPPYQLPSRWMDRRSALTLSTPYNLATTNDIVGGNSGSPLIDRQGQVVGLIFDGNIQSLPGYFMYDETMNRAVSVDSRGIIEVLRKIYDAQPLADELTGSGRRATN